MRVTLRVAFSLILVGVGLLGAITWKYRAIVGAGPGQLETGVQPGELGQWMDPFIGTGGFPWMCGNNFPGAMAPMGMVRLGPETSSLLLHRRALNTSGYFYGDERLLGFSHTRLNGTGATDGGHFLVLPSSRPLMAGRLHQDRHEIFSHRDERAFPGYYAVRLPGAGVLAELTANRRVGLHRYTFDPGRRPHLILDVANALGGRRSEAAMVRVLPEARELEGSVHTHGSFAGRYGGLTVHFVARCNTPFTRFSTWTDDRLVAHRSDAQGDSVGVELGFEPTNLPQSIELHLAISHVSIAHARGNLEAEAGGMDFDLIFDQTRQAWEERLGSVRVEGGTETQRRIFYTALGRVFQMPTLFNDTDGTYIGLDHQPHSVEDFEYYTDLSLWDTFRTVHPLLCLIAPDTQRDICRSLVRMSRDGGWLPRWPSGHGYANSMFGTPADIVIADSWLRGIREFDVESAYQSMRRTALEPTPPGAAFSGRRGITDYREFGYCPTERVNESVARTLEYAWSDHSISLLAESLGHADDARLFRASGQSYRNLWNPETAHFQPRDIHGTFSTPFDPLLLTYLDRKGKLTRDYVEGSALQWRWAVPHDAAGLISLFPSPQVFVDELEDFFRNSTRPMGDWSPGSHYWHGNQPDIHAAYLFNEADRPDLTQKWVRWIMDQKYGTGYAGLDGNDDAGTLSAWYVLSALGLYPVAGSDRYQLGSPIFDRAEVRLRDSSLSVVAENQGPSHVYVRRVTLNGTPLNRWWIRHSEIESGGILKFEMSAEPRQPVTGTR